MTAKTIAYQGEPGANSHIACLDDYPDHQPLACATFEDAFVTLQDGGADLAMIPIENSIAGRVADIHALLPASGLHIIAETFLPIRFQLLAAPGATLATLRTVYSHVHALGQCRKIIRKLGLTPIVSSDTAGSAREVAEARDVTRASLATKLAGEIYGLTTLAADVEDEAHNTTRFVVLSKTPHWAVAHNGPVVTTFVFRVRNVPAALYKALGGFATNGVNMTKLVPRRDAEGGGVASGASLVAAVADRGPFRNSESAGRKALRAGRAQRARLQRRRQPPLTSSRTCGRRRRRGRGRCSRDR